METGAFPIDVTLDDGELTLTQTISLNIGAAPIIEETTEVSETTTDPETVADVDAASEPVPKAEPEPASAEQAELSTASFDWEVAFARLFELRERKKIEQGEAYIEPPSPSASIGDISADGTFSINFSEEIEAVPNTKLITEGKVVDGLGIERPVIDIKVIPGELSEESKMGYSWDIVEMTSRSLTI